MFNGAAAYGDGEVIEANKDLGAQPIDPRTPKGFWDPFFRQINVEQKVELDSIMSVHEAKESRDGEWEGFGCGDCEWVEVSLWEGGAW